MTSPIKKITTENKIIESWINAFGFKEENPKNQTQHIVKKNIKNPLKVNKYHLGKKYPELYLTQREAECIWIIFLKNCTYLEISRYLKLSCRTIEVYINNLKRKMAAKSKSELIALIKTTDFVKNSWELGIRLRKDMDIFF